MLMERLRLEVLHCVARIALRCTSPVGAKRLVDAIGRRLRPHEGIPKAQEALRRLAGRGTCLSQSLTVAARLDGADVVIGVDPRRSAQLAGHAWIEVNGVPLGDREVVRAYEEMARLGRCTRFRAPSAVLQYDR
jgi:hypothetical protein